MASKEKRKTKAELIQEITELRGKVETHEALEEERRKTVTTLRESEIRFRNIFETCKDGIIFFDGETREILLANKVMGAMFGFSPEELVGRTIPSLIPSEQWPHLEQEFQKHVKSGGSVSSDIPVLRKDGSIFYTDIHSSLITLEEKSYFVAFIRDITERKLAEKDLQESEEKFRMIVENSQEGIFLLSLEGEFLYISPSWIDILGYQDLELLGHNYQKLIHPEDLPVVQEVLRRTLEEGVHSPATDYRLRYANGEWRWHRARGNIVRNEKEDPLYFLGVTEDIHERKKTEETLRESEARYRSLFENSDDAILLTAPDGRIFQANPAACRLFELTRAEILEAGRNGLLNLEDPRLKEALEERERTGKFRGELTFKKKGGQRFQGEMTSAVFQTHEGPRTSMIIRDISEQNRSQEALKESEEKYRHLVERAYVGIGIGQDGVLKYVNPSLAEMVGYGIEELIGKPFVDFFIPEEAPRILDRYNRRLAGEEVPPLCESAFQHKDGTRIEVELNAGMIIYQGRSADMVIVRDVTERKRAEESLKISEERFRIAAESSNDFIYEWDIQSGRLEWFDTAPEGLNSIFEEIPVTINAFAHYIHPDDYERVSEAVRRQVRDGQPYHEEYRLIGKKGNIVYIKTAGECLRNERGRAYKWIGVTSDITERKLAEEALVRAEEKYRNIVENAVEGIFQSTTDGKFITANAALANMLAYDSPEQLIESVEDSGTQLYSDPADRDRARKILAERGELKNFEAYVQRKDGKRIWVNLNARLVKDQKGKVLYYEGTAENITERKRAEALIEHNLQETRVRFKVSQALLGKETEDEVLDVLIKEAGISPQALVAILTLEKSEKGPMAVLRRISYFDSGLTQNVSSGTSFPASDFPILNQYLEGRSFVSENILEDQRVDPLVRDLIRRAGGKSFAAFPLKEGMEVLGVLLAVARKDQYIDQAKQHLFQTLADQGAAALQAARLRSQIRESQKRFQGLVETISDWIWEVDIEGVYSYVSPRVRDLLGYEPEELLGKSPYLHHPLGEEGAEKKSFGRLLTSRQPLRGQEIPCRHKKGHIVLFETNGDPFYDERGNFKGYRGINHDITQRKEAQEALAKAEEKYRAIVENAVEGIFQSTVDGRFLMVNRALAKFHGYPSPEEMMKEVIDIGVQLYVNSEERQKYRRILDEHGFVSGFETQLYTRDKKIKWGSLNVRAVKDSQGQLLHYEGTIEDITARKEAEEGQRKTMERLKKSLEGIIQAMALTVETRDPYTAGHQRRVTDLAQALARNMGLSEDRVEGVRMAGIVHDIGKIAIPAEILSKPTKLSDIEFKLIMAHPQISYDILKDIEFPWPLAQIVLQHHERLDGSGYPNGLSGNDICLEARILAVADVVEAISSHRPYRPAFSIETALEEITLKKGKLYHTDVVEACLRLFKERGYAFA